VNNLYPARLAVKILFFLNGFAHANYYGRLPGLVDLYNIDLKTLSYVLLSASIGALIAMPFTGWLIMGKGSRKIGLFSIYFYCLLVPFIPMFSFSVLPLFVVFFLLGVSSGMLDVAMNAQAVMIEQKWGKPIMTSFHAFFSIGMMFGALSASLFSGVDLLTHFSIITIVNVIVVIVAGFYLLNDKPEEKDNGPAFRLPNAAMVGIGIIAFCSMLGEGAMADWSAIFIRDVTLPDDITLFAGFTLTKEAIPPLGLSAFGLAMTIGRLFGDSARVKFGDKKLMVICGMISIIGLAVSIVFVDPLTCIVGFFIVGIGLSSVVPIAYSVGSNAKGLPSGVGLAMVTTVGYSGFVLGPFFIGSLAGMVTLRYALILVLVLFLMMTVLAARYKQS
jgi:MFS family permease